MTNEREAHPVSALALDVYFVDGKAADPSLERHLAGCARCRAYLADLEALGREAPPSWSDPPRSASRERATRGRVRAWRWAAPMGAAAAIAAGLFVHARRADDDGGAGYVGAKGTPAVQALVRNASGARVWDGRSALQPGDAIALRAGCQGFAHVAVAVPAANGAWGRVYAGACATDASDATSLPFTLVVDAQPGDERVAVVFSAAPLDDVALAEAVARGARSPDRWVVAMVFPKSGGRP